MLRRYVKDLFGYIQVFPVHAEADKSGWSVTKAIDKKNKV